MYLGFFPCFGPILFLKHTCMHFIKQHKIGWIKSWNNNVVGWMDVNGFYTNDLWIAKILPLSLSAWPMAMDPKNSPKFHRIPTRGRYPSEVDDSPQLNCYQTHFMNHSGPCDPDCFCDPPASRAKQPGYLQKARLPQGSCPDDRYHQMPILAIS